MTAVEWFANQLGITSGTMLEQAKEMEKAATISKKEIVEISDKEIEEYAKKNYFQYYEFITGAKWYREQLKSRQ